MVNHRISAIIPARGGSKRIPKKNILNFEGKPMIAWTIEAALNSRFISNVIVSTDDEEIASVAVKYGAEVPFLREENRDDFSTASMATVGTLLQMQKTGCEMPEIVVQLLPNCPLRDSGDIDDAVENFIVNQTKFQISCFKFGWMNPWWAFRIDENGKPSTIFDEKYLQKRSQDLPDLFCPTGAIWIAQVIDLLDVQTFYGPDCSFFLMPWKKAVDIDTYEDLELAKILLTS